MTKLAKAIAITGVLASIAVATPAAAAVPPFQRCRIQRCFIQPATLTRDPINRCIINLCEIHKI